MTEHRHNWQWDLFRWSCDCGAKQAASPRERRAFTAGLVDGRASRESDGEFAKRLKTAETAFKALAKNEYARIGIGGVVA